MKPFARSVVAIALSALAAHSAAAEEPLADEAGAAPQAPAARKAFTRRSQPCGTRGDGYFCAKKVPETAAPTPLRPYRVVYPGPGVAVVTWHGMIFCKVSPESRGEISELEYYLHLTLKGPAAFGFNEPGTASIGEHLASFIQDTTQSGLDHAPLTPVTVSNVVKIAAAGAVNHRLTVIPEFRTYARHIVGSFCNVHGGAYTVQFTPD